MTDWTPGWWLRKPERTWWRRHGWRAVSGLLGAAGLVAVVALLVTGPSYVVPPIPYLVENPEILPEWSREPRTYLCYSVFEPPRLDVTDEQIRATDAARNEQYGDPPDATSVDDYCARLRTERLGTGLLVGLASMMFLAGALRRRSDGP